jgi:hypothetical protein
VPSAIASTVSGSSIGNRLTAASAFRVNAQCSCTNRASQWAPAGGVSVPGATRWRILRATFCGACFAILIRTEVSLLQGRSMRSRQRAGIEPTRDPTAGSRAANAP